VTRTGSSSVNRATKYVDPLPRTTTYSEPSTDAVDRCASGSTHSQSFIHADPSRSPVDASFTMNVGISVNVAQQTRAEDVTTDNGRP
jgi:hypothetical protein